MTKDELITKGIEHLFDGQKVLFNVISLEEHFSGLQIHDSDIQLLEQGELVDNYIKHEDINFDSATPNEVEKEYLWEKATELGFTPNLDEFGNKKDGMSFEEAEIILNNGGLVALPEWEGFWFKNLLNLELLVFTKEGEILDTPNEEFKLRTDWIEVEANEEQSSTLEQWMKRKQVNKAKEIEVVDPIVETGKENNAITDSAEEVKKEDTKTSARKDFEAKTTNKK